MPTWSNTRSHGGKCSPQTDEERLERQRRIQVELLEVAPCVARQLSRLLGSGQQLDGRVLAQLVGVVAVHGRLRAGRERNEVAVPSGELLERREQLLALRSAGGAAQTLLRLTL